MKYNNEIEMCKDVTELISGILIPRKHKHIPEVPRTSHNNHADMLFLFETGNMFVVEYKLNNPKGLLAQIMNSNFAIGIVNQKVKKEFYETGNLWQHHLIYSYTGEDWEIEKISERINGKYEFGSNHNKKIGGIESVYYWGYKKIHSSLNGGIKTGKRLSFYELYRQAIINLQEEYNWQLDFYLIYKVLGFYEVGTAKCHYKEVIRQQK